VSFQFSAIVLLVIALNGSFAEVSKRRTPVVSNEPFRTFGLLDSKLSTLSSQQEALKQTVLSAPAASKRARTKPFTKWRRPAREVAKTATSIKILAARQQRRYARNKQRFGVRAFDALAVRAGKLERSAALLERTPMESLAARQLKELEQRSLNLVLQYQAITAGYGATHCVGGSRPCCEPKDNSIKTVRLACNWECVKESTKCRGFSGPSSSLR
jgi:hypothetical protein